VKQPWRTAATWVTIAAIAAGCASAAPPVSLSSATAATTSPLSSVLAATAVPSASPTPAAPTPKPTVAPPPAPTGAKMTSLAAPKTCPAAYGASCFKYEVGWSEAVTSGVTVDVYGVTKCLDKPDCVLATTAIPAAQLTLLASAAASKKAVTFVLGDGESLGAGWVTSSGKTLYIYGVVVQARNAGGKSPTAVAWTW